MDDKVLMNSFGEEGLTNANQKAAMMAPLAHLYAVARAALAPNGAALGLSGRAWTTHTRPPSMSRTRRQVPCSTPFLKLAMDAAPHQLGPALAPVEQPTAATHPGERPESKEERTPPAGPHTCSGRQDVKGHAHSTNSKYLVSLNCTPHDASVEAHDD